MNGVFPSERSAIFHALLPTTDVDFFLEILGKQTHHHATMLKKRQLLNLSIPSFVAEMTDSICSFVCKEEMKYRRREVLMATAG